MRNLKVIGTTRIITCYITSKHKSADKRGINPHKHKYIILRQGVFEHANWSERQRLGIATPALLKSRHLLI